MTDEPIEAQFIPKLLPPQIPLRTRAQRNRQSPIAEATPEWVEELCFVCWVEANRSVPKAMQLLESRWEGLAPEGEPFRQVPLQTWHSWKRRHEWDVKADQIIAQNFPGLRMRQIARLVYSNSAALDFLIGSVQGEFDQLNGATHASRIKAAEILLVAGGLGTHGSKDRIAPIVRSVVETEVNYDEMTEQELARHTMEAIRKSKTAVPERKR